MKQDTCQKQPFFSLIPFLISIGFASFLNQLARTTFPSMTPYICKEMDLCHSEIGNLFFILSIGFAIALFLSQFLSSKISHRKTVTLSIFLTGLAITLTSYTEDFQLFRCALLAVGFFAGFLTPSLIAMMRETIPYEHMGKAFGLYASAQSIAFILGPTLVQFFIHTFTWRQILNGMGLFSSLSSLLLFSLFKKGGIKGERITFFFIKSIFSQPSFWILMGLLCIANGLNIGIYNMAPDYFQKDNLISHEKTHQLIVLARALTIFTALFGGILADRFGLKGSIAYCFIACGLLTMLIGAAPLQISLVLFTFQSPIAGCLMALTHLAISTIVPPEKNAALTSLIAPFGFLIGAGGVPQLLGLFGDLNLYSQGFLFFGLTALLSGILFNIHPIYRHIQVSQMKQTPEV